MSHARPNIAAFVTAALMGLVGANPSGVAIHLATANPASLVLPAQAGCQVAGPFPTMQRATEAAGEARRRGLSAVAYRDSGGYYVHAC